LYASALKRAILYSIGSRMLLFVCLALSFSEILL
jgi:hypothetical protein